MSGIRRLLKNKLFYFYKFLRSRDVRRRIPLDLRAVWDLYVDRFSNQGRLRKCECRQRILEVRGTIFKNFTIPAENFLINVKKLSVRFFFCQG